MFFLFFIGSNLTLIRKFFPADIFFGPVKYFAFYIFLYEDCLFLSLSTLLKPPNYPSMLSLSCPVLKFLMV
jgi:hypothetical protein